MQILDRLHFIGGLAPDADRFGSDDNTDIYELQGEGAAFLVWYGTNAANGASTLQVDACDGISATNSTHVAFYYKSSTTFDTWGDWAAATTAGITVGGSADSAWWIYVPAAELASEGYGYVRVNTTESADHTADGVVAAFVVEPRYVAQPESLID